MRFVRFTTSQHPGGTYGLRGGDGRIEIVRSGLLDPVEKTGEVIAEKDVLQNLPLVNPPNVVAIGLNYINHAEETKDKLPTKPLVFLKATSAVTAHGEPIQLPKVAPNEVDYEAELAVIIGREARHVSEQDALDYVFGYACANDVSARDCQMSDGQWARGKSFDTFAPIGPWIETDLDPSALRVRMTLNGELMQNQSTLDMVFNVPYLVSYLSRSMTLLPGTVIMTGTPGGVGFTRTPPVFLRPGDVCEVEIDGIGILRNAVEAE